MEENKTSTAKELMWLAHTSKIGERKIFLLKTLKKKTNDRYFVDIECVGNRNSGALEMVCFHKIFF